MADVSTVTMPDGSVKDIKDSISRSSVSELVDNGAKNVLEFDAIGTTTYGPSYESNGVKFTLNADNTVTFERISTSSSAANCLLILNGARLDVSSYCDGSHVLSGCPSGGGSNTYEIMATVSGGAYTKRDYGSGVILDSVSAIAPYVQLTVRSGFTGTATFKPMICTKADWDISHTYQPYRKDLAELTVDSDEDRAALVELVDNGAKNILDLTKASEVVKADELSYTLAADGTLTVTWTADLSSSGKTLQFKGFPYKAGTYILSGAQLDGSSTAVRADVREGSTPIVMDYGQPPTPFELPSNGYNYVIRVQAPAGSATFKPMICTKAAWDISHEYEPYALPNPELTAATVELVDDGAKNRVPLSFTSTSADITVAYSNNKLIINGSSTTAQSVYSDIYLDSGTYMITGCPAGGGSDSYQCELRTSTQGSMGVADTGNGKQFTLTTAGNYRYNVRIAANYTASNLEISPMICTKAAWDISHAYVPYRPSEDEQNAQIASNGLRVVLSQQANTSTTYTYQMKTADFSVPYSCGCYVISIITWGTTPAYSLYSVAYSGNHTNYTVITKIAGSDANLTVSGDTISVTSSGKVTIMTMK